MSSYIWDVSNPNTPDFELTPQSQLTSINFNLKDTSLVGAGQYNGQFAYFDMRKGSTPVEASPIEHSHRSVRGARVPRSLFECACCCQLPQRRSALRCTDVWHQSGSQEPPKRACNAAAHSYAYQLVVPCLSVPCLTVCCILQTLVLFGTTSSTWQH